MMAAEEMNYCRRKYNNKFLLSYIHRIRPNAIMRTHTHTHGRSRMDGNIKGRFLLRRTRTKFFSLPFFGQQAALGRSREKLDLYRTLQIGRREKNELRLFPPFIRTRFPWAKVDVEINGIKAIYKTEQTS